MTGKTNAGGGGLNLRVVGGTTAPVSPQENTIWVNTATPISGWAVSNTRPVSPESGFVLIYTGSASAAPLENRSVTLYPHAVWQYSSGAWTHRSASVYQNGSWVPLTLYLFYDGDECSGVTGGWVSEALPYSSGGNGSALTVTDITNGVKLAMPSNMGGRGGIYRTVQKIDLTGYSGIGFRGTGYKNQNPIYLVVTPNIGEVILANQVANLSFPDGTTVYDGDDVLDVSGVTGENYIYFAMCSTDDKYIDVNRLWLT